MKKLSKKKQAAIVTAIVAVAAVFGYTLDVPVVSTVVGVVVDAASAVAGE